MKKLLSKKLIISLTTLLIVMVAVPAIANNREFTEEERIKIVEYINELERKNKLKDKKIQKLNALIDSIENENELLRKKVDNLNIMLKKEQKEDVKEQMKAFGFGAVTGAGITLFLLLR